MGQVQFQRITPKPFQHPDNDLLAFGKRAVFQQRHREQEQKKE